MLVREAMTGNPTCCIPSDAAQTAAIIMRDEDTGIVPVVESNGSRKLVGVVTDRDLCNSVIAERPRLDPTNVSIEQCMTSKVIFCKPDDDLGVVLELMQENQIRRILVVDGQGAVQGIVSMADLVNRGELPRGATRETLKSISKPTGESSKPRAESAKAGV
ncbi:MAG TPA: CBS domain-containing protein [Blastocatellia bacterium]|nr:CBS domain-containing protein [Blastocatellia bacterium]